MNVFIDAIKKKAKTGVVKAPPEKVRDSKNG
jgi:hypothetical protein